MGVILHSFKSFFKPEWQQYVSIILGSMLLIAGILSFFPLARFKVKLPWTGFVQKNLGTFMANPTPAALFVTGMLNGLLPCGLVYMALSATIIAPTVTNAVALMYAFGLGTTPMLIALTVIKDKTRLSGMGHIRKFVPVVMLFFGSLFVIRGMNLGIPYLSPKVAVEQNEIKSDCCHKK